MSVKRPFYPQRSDNIHRNSLEFWNELGISTDRVQEVDRFSDRLYAAPVSLKVEEDFQVTDYSNLGKEPEGEIGLQAAKKLLGGKIAEGDELTVRMIDYNDWPEDTYDASLKVVDESEVCEDIEKEYLLGAIMMDLEETPPTFEYGKIYDFIVFNDGSSTIVADQDYEFDLQEWR
jgi:hypothetical protein